MNGVAVVSHWSMRVLIGSVFQEIGVSHLSESPTTQVAHVTWKKRCIFLSGSCLFVHIYPSWCCHPSIILLLTYIRLFLLMLLYCCTSQTFDVLSVAVLFLFQLSSSPCSPPVSEAFSSYFFYKLFKSLSFTDCYFFFVSRWPLLVICFSHLV